MTPCRRTGHVLRHGHRRRHRPGAADRQRGDVPRFGDQMFSPPLAVPASPHHPTLPSSKLPITRTHSPPSCSPPSLPSPPSSLSPPPSSPLTETGPARTFTPSFVLDAGSASAVPAGGSQPRLTPSPPPPPPPPPLLPPPPPSPPPPPTSPSQRPGRPRAASSRWSAERRINLVRQGSYVDGGWRARAGGPRSGGHGLDSSTPNTVKLKLVKNAGPKSEVAPTTTRSRCRSTASRSRSDRSRPPTR